MKKTLILALVSLMYFSSPCETFAQKYDYTTEPDEMLAVGETMYWISSKAVTLQIREGDPDIEFTVTIAQSPSHVYGFSIIGYGEGLPPYAILGTKSGGALGSKQVIPLRLTSSVFSADGKKPKTYRTRLPIHIYHGSERNDSSFLFVPIQITVYPRA